jgi:hypothetical protein
MGFILLSACCLLTACNSTQQIREIIVEKESKMEKVKVIEIPAGKMIKTPEYVPGSADFFRIMKQLWVNVVDRHTDIFPRDFEQWNDDTGKGFWLYSIMSIDISKFDTSGFEIIDFEGGYYATATAIDPDNDNESMQNTIQEVKDWVNQSKFFELDFDMKRNRCFMSNRPLGDKAEDVMDYVQVEIFIPIKPKK